MSDEKKRPGTVDGWKNSVVGLDRDAWEKTDSRNSRDYRSVAESLAFYFRLFVESPIAVIVTTPTFEIADANNAAQRLFQRSLSEMRSRPFRLSVARSDRDALSDIVAEVRAASSPISRPLLIKIRDDVTAEVIVTASMIRTAEGEPEFAVMVFLERGENISSDIL